MAKSKEKQLKRTHFRTEEEAGEFFEEEEDDEEEDEDVAVASSVATNSANNGISNDNTTKQLEEEEERARMKILLSNFDDEQMSRYEAFRRANINRSSVKRLANAVLNQSITGNVAVALSGMSKMFVGDIVELARDVRNRAEPGKDGEPLRPEHIREAWRLYKEEAGTVPEAIWRSRDGLGDGLMFR